jgi:DnaJ family protein C protein 11
MDVRSRRVPSSAVDDGASIRSRACYNSNHRLRPAESRFSLREQFAATRREYEFGFDDASSILERSTLASEAVGGDDLDDTVIVESASPAFSDGNLVSRDCYELLCLPRGPSLSSGQVQEAARRLVQVLAVDKQPPRLQSPAAFYLGLAQAAYETLVEPSRRIGYDLSGVEEASSDCDLDGTIIDEEEHDRAGSSDTYETRIQDQYLLLTQRESRATSDLGLRIDASLLTSQRGSQRHASGLEVLDLCLRKSSTVSVPSLRQPMERALYILHGLTKSAHGPDLARSLRLADPTVTVIGLTHGLLDEPYKLASLLNDRYQPPGPSIHGRRRMEQLLASRFLPALSLNLRQEVFWRSEPLTRTFPDLVVEQEVELLPQLSTTTRIGHSINIPSTDELLNIEVSVQKLLTRRASLSPGLGFAVHQRVGPGTAFLVADGGDGNLRTSRECRELSKFSKISGGVAPIIDAFRNPPTVEIGYAFGRHDLGMPSGQALTKPSERGLSSLDCDLDENKPSSWTLSTGLTPGSVAAYLRYGRDLFPFPTSQPSPTPRPKSSFRAEAELAGTTHRDFFLAFRALKRIGRFSKAGLEIGLSPANLHLSLYWSRLGQRITLPFLIASTKSRLATKILFWTTVFPFAALAAWELYRQRQRASKVAAAKAALMSTPKHKEKVQEYVSRRRAEADELTVILATGVEPRQTAERQRGGLVIVSAKYGVRDAPPEEVADVTIAVAALVDDGGRLVIPAGVRKSRLLGFWDPAPMSTKVLRVRYLWQGKELAVEVSGREELRLP